MGQLEVEDQEANVIRDDAEGGDQQTPEVQASPFSEAREDGQNELKGVIDTERGACYDYNGFTIQAVSIRWMVGCRVAHSVGCWRRGVGYKKGKELIRCSEMQEVFHRREARSHLLK